VFFERSQMLCFIPRNHRTLLGWRRLMISQAAFEVTTEAQAVCCSTSSGSYPIFLI
jgi:hypothetical protein